MSSRYSAPCAVTVPIASVATDAIATVAVRALMFGLMLGKMVDGNRKGQCLEGYDGPYMTTGPMHELVFRTRFNSTIQSLNARVGRCYGLGAMASWAAPSKRRKGLWNGPSMAARIRARHKVHAVC